MEPQSALYYECHITIDPIFDGEREEAEILAKTEKFKLAKLLMQKRKEDTPEASKYDTFMTGHSATYSDLNARMVRLYNTLTQAGFKVRRYKIEKVILDERF